MRVKKNYSEIRKHAPIHAHKNSHSFNWKQVTVYDVATKEESGTKEWFLSIIILSVPPKYSTGVLR